MIKELKRCLLLVGVLISFTACETDDEGGKIVIYADHDLFDSAPEFFYGGKSLTSEYLGIDALYSYTASVASKNAGIDYNYDFGGERFSSLAGEAAVQGAKVMLRADDKSGRNSYELRPTGDHDNPFLVFDLNEDDGGSGDACGDYAGPEFNIQIDSQCKTAQLYLCAGNSDGVTVACGLYKQYQAQDSSIPNCPYCN
ncbi:MAG: hypothetical protein ABJG41_18565 [Cyclobacteriaceae bacterium]